MADLKPTKQEDFTLQKVKISDKGVEVKFLEKRQVENKTETISHNITANYQPHPDLIAFRDELKEYLFKAYGMHRAFDMAEKYLKGEQKKKLLELKAEELQDLQVTGISIGGEDQLRGAVISGKKLSTNDAKTAMNAPRIVFSSENLGYEKDVEKLVQLIEIEVYKYVFQSKTAQLSIFDGSDDDGDDSKIKDLPVQAEEVSNGKSKEAASA